MTSRGHAANPELAEMRRLGEENAIPPDPADATVAEIDADGVPILRFVPESASDIVLLHFHGGGYRLGSPRTFAAAFARISKAVGAQILAVKYRLAPEDPFPAGLEDAVTAYRWLIASGVPAERIVVSGDSAGGGLAAALLLRIAELGLETPAGGALFSAWLDLRITSPSYAENAETDLLFSQQRAEDASELYLRGHDASDPLASPILADWTGQPPLLIQVSDIEVLRDDSLVLAKSASDAGVAVELKRFPDTQHIWHTEYPATEASVRAIENLRDFLTLRLKA